MTLVPVTDFTTWEVDWSSVLKAAPKVPHRIWISQDENHSSNPLYSEHSNVMAEVLGIFPTPGQPRLNVQPVNDINGCVLLYLCIWCGAIVKMSTSFWRMHKIEHFLYSGTQPFMSMTVCTLHLGCHCGRNMLSIKLNGPSCLNDTKPACWLFLSSSHLPLPYVSPHESRPRQWCLLGSSRRTWPAQTPPCNLWSSLPAGEVAACPSIHHSAKIRV